MHRATLIITLALIALVFPSSSHAGSYWWNGAPHPSGNGFSWSNADGPYWNPWGGRCETRGTTIPAGNPCTLTWHVPAGLDAGGGSISGIYKQANANFEQRNFVDGNGTTTLQGTATQQSFVRQWPDMGAYMSITLITPTATTVSAASQYFQADAFSVSLTDPSTPSANILAVPGGWQGPGGACVRYGFADAGSGINSQSLSSLDTGAVYDAPSWSTSAIVTGVTQTDRTICLPAIASGTLSYRIAAADKSGNVGETTFAIAFDTTAPTIGAPMGDGAELANGRRFLGSANAYRPTLSFTAGDAHSGVASRSIVLDGAAVSSGTTFTPPADLAPGDHTVVFRASDAVGNAASVTRTFTIVDDVAPVLEVASPDADGGPEPVLDVTAHDDNAGLDPVTWTVKVNGETLVASSSTARLQANLGTLVDGTHELRITVADRAGNVATHTREYHADSGDDLPDAPGLNGMFVMSAPDRVEEGTTQVIRAIVVRAGRPVTGTVELRRGDEVLADATIASSGAVTISATIAAAGPLTLHPPAGSGLEPVDIEYEFVPKPAPTPIERCAAFPRPADCGAGDGGSGGAPAPAGSTTNTTNNITNLGPAFPSAADAAAAGGGGGYPRNVVYYVGNVPYWNGIPLAESGAPLDRAAPVWKLVPVRERAGTVRRLGRVAFRLWTNEMSVLNLTPRGAGRRTTVNPRRTWRTVHVRIGAKTPLGRTLARTRAGAVAVIRIRVTATDTNENRSTPRWVTFRIRV